MKIAVGSDHGGFALKEKVKEFLQKKSVQYTDFGTFSSESVDYPDFGEKVAVAVVSGEYDRGIICCGTGIGIALAANKVQGARAAACTDTFSARMSKEHNDANVLALGERVTGPGLAMDIVSVWLASEFAGGRHERRVEKIKAIERRQRGG